MDGDKNKKVKKEVNENQPNTEPREPTDSNNMKQNGEEKKDQSEFREPSNSQSLNQNAADSSEVSLLNKPSDLSVQPRFGRKRPLSQSNAESQMQLGNDSVIQNLDSQPSLQASSQWDGECSTCKGYKVEIKRLQQTNKRLTREAEAAKLRMDNNMAIALKGQETLQKELLLLRRNCEKQHLELTAIKSLMREIQSAIGRYKF